MSLRPANESLFWYWIRERHAIYERRASGLPKPWTGDQILREYKFTNVFRELDAGTMWLREHFLEPHRADDAGLLLFNVTWYRLFNWRGTGELLGWQTRWDRRVLKRKLAAAQRRGDQVFTGAHVVCGVRGKAKIDSTLDTCATVWAARNRLTKLAVFSRSLRAVFEELIRVRGIGPFIGYEIVTDLRHTRLLDAATDINTWANVGPGAMRGLRRLDPAVLPGTALGRMRDLLLRSPLCLDGSVPPLELRDIEHSLCEFDKYCRVKFGEGKPRSRYDGGYDVVRAAG